MSAGRVARDAGRGAATLARRRSAGARSTMPPGEQPSGEQRCQRQRRCRGPPSPGTSNFTSTAPAAGTEPTHRW